MLNNMSEVFSLEEVALENTHLLPEAPQSRVYFVTAMQGENKKVIFIGFAKNLRKKFAVHKRRMEFEFLDRMGYQINISWIVLPDGMSYKQKETVQGCYIWAFKPKLNSNHNTLATLEAEESRRRNERWERSQYGYLDKQIENWKQSGDDQETLIKKIWEAGKERLMVNI
jgi:hypothetical protein